MAEWALLLLLVPAVVIPVVLLLGFAGCDVVFGLHRPTAILSAAATSRSSIRLEWVGDEDIESFRIEVTQFPAETLLPAIQPASSPFEITGLMPGTLFGIRVLGFSGGDTYPSAQVFESTLSVAFDTAADVGPPGDQPAQGFCVVQRIEPVRLTASGSRVLMFLRGPTAGAASIARIYISQAAGGDPYDSAADLTPVFDVGNPPTQPALIVQGAGEVALPIFDYVLDRTQPLLMAFDLTPGFPSSVSLLPLLSADAVVFFQLGLQEAGIPGGDRTPGYQSANGVALITRIEVG